MPAPLLSRDARRKILEVTSLQEFFHQRPHAPNVQEP